MAKETKSEPEMWFEAWLDVRNLEPGDEDRELLRSAFYGGINAGIHYLEDPRNVEAMQKFCDLVLGDKDAA
jgi:hypothetical protein